MIRSQLLNEYKEAKSNNVNYQRGTGGSNCPLPLPQEELRVPPVSLPTPGETIPTLDMWLAEPKAHSWPGSLCDTTPDLKKAPLRTESPISLVCVENSVYF